MPIGSRRILGLLALGLALTAARPLGAAGFDVSAGLEPEAMWSESRGATIDAGWFVGVALEPRVGRAFELRRLAQEFEHSEIETWQLGLRWSFPPGRRLEPFAIAGLHYGIEEWERRPFAPAEREEEAGGFVGAGFDWPFADPVSFRLDVRMAGYDDEEAGWSTAFDLTVGLALRF